MSHSKHCCTLSRNNMLRQICALHIVKQVSELPACGPNKCYSNPLLFHSTAVTDLTLKASFHIERIACASVMAKAAAYQKDDSLRISYLMPRWCFCTIICTSIQAPEGKLCNKTYFFPHHLGYIPRQRSEILCH